MLLLLVSPSSALAIDCCVQNRGCDDCTVDGGFPDSGHGFVVKPCLCVDVSGGPLNSEGRSASAASAHIFTWLLAVRTCMTRGPYL